MKYIWQGNEYTQEQIDDALNKTGKLLDEYLSENNIEAVEEENGPTDPPRKGEIKTKKIDTGKRRVEIIDGKRVSTPIYEEIEVKEDFEEFIPDPNIDYESLPLMDRRRSAYDDWKEKQYEKAEEDFVTPGKATVFEKPSDIAVKLENTKKITDEVTEGLKDIKPEAVTSLQDLNLNIRKARTNIINSDPVLQAEIKKTVDIVEKARKKAVDEIIEQTKLDVLEAEKIISPKYNLSDPNDLEKAEEELEKIRDKKIQEAEKLIDETNKEFNKNTNLAIGRMSQRKTFKNRLALVEKEINKQIEPILRDQKIKELPGFGKLLKYVDGTAGAQLIAGVEQIGKSFEAGIISLKQLGIDEVNRQLDQAKYANGGIGIRDNQTVYVYPDGEIDFEKSNIKAPEVIGQAPATPRDGRFNLKGELETDKVGVFGKVQSEPMTFADYKKEQNQRLKDFSEDIKINLKSIEEYDKVLDLIPAPELFDEDGATTGDVIGTIFRMAPQIAVGAAGAAAAPYTGGGSLVASQMFMFANEYGNNYWEGVQQGLMKDIKEKEGVDRLPTNEEIVDALINDKYQKQGIAAGWAAVSSLLEQGTAIRGLKDIKGLNEAIKNTSKRLGFEDLRDLLVKTGENNYKDLLRGGGSFLIKTGKRGVTEGLVESTQGVSNQLSVQQIMGEKASLKDIDTKQLKEEGGAGFIMGAVLPIGRALYDGGRNFIRKKALVAAGYGQDIDYIQNWWQEAQKALTELKNNGNISKEEYYNSSQELAAIKDAAMKIPKNFSSKSRRESLDLMVERQRLQKEIDDLDKAFTQEQVDRVKEINEELAEIATREKVRQAVKKQLKETASIKGQDVPADADLIIYDDKNIEDISKEYNIPVEKLRKESEGIYVRNKNIILISEEASKGVEEHEGFHNYMDIGFSKNPNLVFALGDLLIEKMRRLNPEVADAIQRQLEKYEADPNYPVHRVVEEISAYYAQLKSRGFFQEADNRTFIQKFIDYINEVLQGLGFKKLVVTSENFDRIIDNYIANIQKGNLTQYQNRIAKGFFEVGQDLETIGAKAREREEARVKTLKEAREKAEQRTIEQEQKIRELEEVSEAKKLDEGTRNKIDALVQNPDGSRKFETKQQFQSSEEFGKLYSEIFRKGTEGNPNLFENTIRATGRSRGVPPEAMDNFVEESKLRLIEKIVGATEKGGFDPAKNESLFGYLFGKTNIVVLATGDVANKYKKEVKGPSLDAPTAEGVTREVEDVSQDVEKFIEETEFEAPKSKLRRQLVMSDGSKIGKKQIEELEKIASEVRNDPSLPDPSDKNYRKKFLKLAGKKAKPWVVKNILGGRSKDNYSNALTDNILPLFGGKNLSIKYLIDAEKEVDPKDKIFTKFDRKLTTQADIRKFKESGDVFVVNEAQGVNKYDRLTPKPFQIKDFYLGNQSAQNITNKKGVLAEEIGSRLISDITPQVAKKEDVPTAVRSKISEQLQNDPELLFARKLPPIEITLESGVEQMAFEDYIQDQKFWRKLAEDLDFKSYDFNKEQDRIDFKEKEMPKLVKALPREFFEKSPGTFAGTPKSKKVKGVKTGEKIYGLPFDSKTGEGGLDQWLKDFEQSDEFEGYGAPFKNADGSDMDRATMQKALSRVGQKGEKFDKDFGSDEFVKVVEDKELILKQFFERIQDAGEDSQQAFLGVLQATSFHQSHFIRTICPITFRQLNIEGKSVEEHALGASLMAKWGMFLAKNNAVDDNFAGVANNFVQGPIAKTNDNKVNRKEYGMKTGPKKEDLFNTLIGAYNWVVRYASVPDFDLNTIEILDENNNKVMLTDYYNVRVKEKSFPELIAYQNSLIVQLAKGEITKAEARKLMDEALPVLKEKNIASKEDVQELSESRVLDVSDDMTMEDILGKAATIDEALNNANKLDQPVKKIRVFDFDDTLATSKNIVYATKGDKTISLNAEEFAKRGLELKEDGWVMDFSDFNKVTDGGRGPLFDVAKKIKEARGNEDLFVLTARPAEAADAIYEFSKAEGLEFKRENIVGLGNSTGEAKANWIIDRAAEGYNDFYFADDAYQNVKAVQDALSVIDVKSKVQQARISESKKLSEDFNKILEQTTGIAAEKVYSKAKAEVRGASKGKFKFYIPPSAEDFLGLIYPTLSKGKLGENQLAWYKENILDPYNRATQNLSTERINMMNDFRQLKKSLKVPKDLRKTTESGFTNEQAVRVYLWNKTGEEVPGLSKTDLKELTDIVEKDPKLKIFADQILSLTKGDGYSKPTGNWLVGTITTDLIDLLNTTKRDKYLADWKQRVDAVYSEDNLNKLQAIYGPKYRNALENILSRMKSGKNRASEGGRLSNMVLDYINGSVGAIMFFNTRSAVLQTISAINFVNWSFNNPYQAGKAFANQPQYWKDFTTLMNSDYLKDRRNGLKLNISENEIAEAAKTSKNKAKAALNYILQKGYLPTQFADSFAIASGGATFYRNRINDLIKNQGMTEQEAEKQALQEWRDIAEVSQQSSDPSKISQQQASSLGRILLAFANTPMQYARIQKRAFQDLVNRRGSDKENISKIIYYGFIQNMIFNALQQAAFAIGFGDDEEDQEQKTEKLLDVTNGMIDSQLKGLGVGGQAVSVVKNYLLDIYERSGRKRPEYVDATWKLLQFSPPISSKLSKLKQAAWNFDNKKRREQIYEKGFALDNPAYEAGAKVISATTNVPLDRVYSKIENIQAALAEDTDWWQTVAMLGGWPEWQIKPKEKKQETKKPKYIIPGSGGVIAPSKKQKKIIVVD